MLPFTHTWLPFIYLYVVGGILFAAGVILTYRMKSLDLTKKHHFRWFGLLFFGFFWYLTMHAFLNLVALGHPEVAWWLLGSFAVLSILGYGFVHSRTRSES